MSDLREKVARVLYGADFRTGYWPEWDEADEHSHAAFRKSADAAIAVCMEEAAKVASGGYPEKEGGEYAYGRLDAAAALRALRGEGGAVDG